MPQRHSPPPVAEPHTEAEEKLKRPKRNGSAKRENGLRDLLHEETLSLTHSETPAQITSCNEVRDAEAPASSPASTVDNHPPLATQLSPLSSPDINSSAMKDGSEQGQAAPKSGVIVVDGIEFHHESEAEFARLLNYYGIEWLYEPHQFPLQWHDDRVTEMFRPDFYLVEYDFYIELTTMRQSLVRKKNRKLRLLRALYPEINIKLLYRRDYNRLLERFSIGPGESERSGATTE